jgi:hypothetical protein
LQHSPFILFVHNSPGTAYKKLIRYSKAIQNYVVLKLFNLCNFPKVYRSFRQVPGEVGSYFKWTNGTRC